MRTFKHLIIFCLAFFVSKNSFCAVKDTLSLADALQSNMILQQNKAFKVWGKANSGDQVSIQADWMPDPITVIAAADGRFEGLIDIPEAKKGDFSQHQIRIETQEQKRKLVNLLIGDVWFCSGQSNMQFAVREMIGAEKILNAANQPNIRLLSVGLNFSEKPIDNFSGKWQECSPYVAKSFSAVGYTFGRKLYDELNIPIGIIFSGIGASAVQAYIPQEELANDVVLNETYLKPYINSAKSKEKVDGGFSFEKVVRPFLLYNAMIHPFLNLSVKGFCWYQGESNHMERESYVKATQVMIGSWRKRFKQGSLPFYYVQIAPYSHDKEDPKIAFDAFFREAQGKISDLNNTAMICTMDVGDAKDLHPKNKEEIGKRLAAVALNKTYDQLSVVYQGPDYSHVSFENKSAVIYFKPETVGGGLTTSDGFEPKFFYLAGENRVFYPATARISGNTILVNSNKVRRPKAVRYAFFNYPVTNLQNREGFPAVPFRTDNWFEINSQ